MRATRAIPTKIASVPKAQPYVGPGWSDVSGTNVAQPWVGDSAKMTKPQRGGPNECDGATVFNPTRTVHQFRSHVWRRFLFVRATPATSRSACAAGVSTSEIRPIHLL